VVLRPEQSFTVPARAGDLYRCFSVQTSFGEDRYFTAAGVVPGNSRARLPGRRSVRSLRPSRPDDEAGLIGGRSG
jgi:hypothetical protein